MLYNDAKFDTIKYQEMLEEAFDLIQKLSEYEIGLECEDMDRETAMTELYRMARNLFTGELEVFWKEGEAGKAAF